MLQDLSLSGLVTLLISAAVLMASPGPTTMSVTATAAAFGFRRSLAYCAGLNLGTILVLLAVAVGATALLHELPGVSFAVSLAAALYILYLAWRIAMAPPLSEAAAAGSEPGWLAGFTLAIANPKAYLAIGAVYAQSTLLAGRPLSDALLKCLLLAVAIVAIHMFWALAGSALTRVLRHPAASRAVNLGLASTLVLLVLAEFL
ncbi:LysE family translocator [Nordella sp. HKS 07]|uniref:LysE family translocator n=1 Tax=Nordella sp. HKS 07 TaxID=2712222 RepID=UPI0013E15009|nr:LysE family translocator [Nordella sp. HKS 07]QIG49052.1 LysE family translocator [Nordella sp. HKS 07]